MNTHVVASGSGRASVIHPGLGLKCPEHIFSRFRYTLHQAKSGKGGRTVYLNGGTSFWGGGRGAFLTFGFWIINSYKCYAMLWLMDSSEG